MCINIILYCVASLYNVGGEHILLKSIYFCSCMYCMLYVHIVCWNVYCAVMCGDADTDSGAGPRHRQGPR